MSLAAGSRLGPYEIVGSLGAGGMGEVYRAHDSRFQRDVAETEGARAVSLSPGTQLGVYEIIGWLGAGPSTRRVRVTC